MSATQKLLANIAEFHRSPGSVVQGTLDVLEEVLGDVDIVDATNPFMLLLEANATGVAAAISESESVLRRLYPRLAVGTRELFSHLSDREFIGVYGTPSNGSVTVLLPLLDLLSAALTVSPELQLVVIPKDTVFTLNTTNFGIYDDIRIEVLPGDVIEVLHVPQGNNPWNHTYASNVVPNRIVRVLDTKYLELQMPVFQFSHIVRKYNIGGTSTFTKTITFTDGYYNTRIYTDRGNAQWEEILTTHNQIVFDAGVPTAVLEVIDQTLEVRIPDIYYTQGLIGTRIRIDVFTTQGDLTYDLSQHSSKKWGASWVISDEFYDNSAVAPLSKINDLVIYGTGYLTGGVNGRTLEEIRERLIYRVDSSHAPIRLNDIKIGLSDRGYIVQPLVDSITNRVYIASRNLPVVQRSGLELSVLATNTTIAFDVAWGVSTGTHRGSIKAHATKRTTITSRSLIDIANGGIALLSDTERALLDGYTVSELIANVNQRQLMYNPFYYVLDHTQDVLGVRVYDLDTPSVINRTLLNRVVNVSITTTVTTLELVNGEYTLTIQAAVAGTGNSVINVQMSYADTQVGTRYYINSILQLVDQVWTAVFILPTSFDISNTDLIEMTGFRNTSDTPVSLFVPLELSVQLFYVVESSTATNVAWDSGLVITGWTNAVNTITQESFILRLGDKLERLYTPSRTIVQQQEYQRYSSDVSATWETDVYEQDQWGSKYTTRLDGTVDFTLLHAAGDPVLNQGVPVIEHGAGDYILDTQLHPIPMTSSQSAILYQVGLTLVNAMYLFASTPTAVSYLDGVTRAITGYLRDDLAPAADQLLERTEIYYRPRNATNNVLVELGDGLRRYIPSAINFNISFWITELGMQDPEALKQITVATRTALTHTLTGSRISIAEITRTLLNINPQVITGVHIDRLDGQYSIATLQDIGAGWYIPEQMELQPDGTIDITDNVVIEFKLT